jgi:adenine-specific DNA-methyltransferase
MSEHYGLSWAGKSEAIKRVSVPSTATLKELPHESVNFDTTENIFVEGDNLDALKIFQAAYREKIKCIIIDPPYNTGSENFIYFDNFKDHSGWLNMMFPRLSLARDLMRDDGVIFIHIDDNEVYNLRLIMNEIFGEENFVAELVWEKKKKGAFLSGKYTNIKEYIVTYCKNKDAFGGLIGEINDDTETYPCVNDTNKTEARTIPAGIKSKFRQKDHFVAKGSKISGTTMELVLHSDLVIKNFTLAENLVIEGKWRYSQEGLEEFAAAGELYVTEDLYIRRIVTHPRFKKLKDILPKEVKGEKEDLDTKNLFNTGWGTNEDAKEEIRLLTGIKNLMDYPKPVRLVEKLIASIRDTDFIVLDFFAGSGTTAHAVMDLNRRDNGNRKFICVQLDETVSENTNAFKAGYKNIAEIAKLRIKKAIEQIDTDNANNSNFKLDLGFKSYKVVRE